VRQLLSQTPQDPPDKLKPALQERQFELPEPEQVRQLESQLEQVFEEVRYWEVEQVKQLILEEEHVKQEESHFEQTL
jgi:hypothetical protein